MRNLPLLGASALLVIWLLGGSSWYGKQYCEASTSTPAVKQPLLYIEDELNEIAKTPAPEFRLNEALPFLSASTIYDFRRLADYLVTNPGRLLILTGHSSAEETTANIGIQRADAFAQLLISQGAPPQSIVTAAAQKADLEFENGVSWQAVRLEFDSNQGSHPDFMPLNLYFSDNKYQVITNRALEEYASQLREFLALHPELVVQISGFVDKSETRNPAALSLKRAKSLRDYLVKAGIPVRHLHLREDKKPLVANSERSKNRRAEIRITRA